MENKFTLGVVLFEEFELLDVCGPLEIFGSLPNYFDIKLIAEHSGGVSSAQGPQLIANHTFDQRHAYDILLIPGGRGTRREVENLTLLEWLKIKGIESQLVTSVCTGSALLAKTGILDGKRATTNKAAFKWVSSRGINHNKSGNRTHNSAGYSGIYYRICCRRSGFRRTSDENSEAVNEYEKFTEVGYNIYRPD